MYTTNKWKKYTIKTASERHIWVQSCNIRPANMISIMFNIIPKPEYAKFYIFESKKL